MLHFWKYGYVSANVSRALVAKTGRTSKRNFGGDATAQVVARDVTDFGSIRWPLVKWSPISLNLYVSKDCVATFAGGFMHHTRVQTRENTAKYMTPQ